MLSNRLYWWLQASFWGLLAVYHIVFRLSFGELPIEMVAGYIAASLVGLMGTHVLRTIAHTRRWPSLPFPRFAWRVSAGAACIALGIVFTALSVEAVLNRSVAPLQPEFSRLALYLGYWTLVVHLWSAAYFALYFYRRSREAELERWQLDALWKRAQLQSLRAQLDPHFMFNSLNSIRALIVEDGERAQEMVTRLSNVLRYSLRSDRDQWVSLQQEMKTVRSYLDIEHVRFEDRLRVDIEMDEELLSVSVPPMLVQTLVENAIKHGVSKRPEGGTVRVAARREGDDLVVTVENSGSLDTPDEETGLGLRNARERIEILYGDRGSLELGESQPGLVVATITIPMEADDEDDPRR